MVAFLLAAALACPPIGAGEIVIIYYNPPHNCTPISSACKPNEPILFSAVGNYNFGCGPHAYSWRFSDGTIMTGRVVTKTFADFGVHQVDLTVVNPQQTATVTRVISVGVEPFSVTATPRDGRLVELRAIRSSEANLGAWTWNLGDGTVITTRDDVITHRYRGPGKYVVSLFAAHAPERATVEVTATGAVKRRATSR